MRAILLWPILASLVTSAPLCAQSNTVLTNQYVQGSGSYNAYLIASLPANTTGDYDHLHIIATLNSNWFGFANSSIDAIFSNRTSSGFIFLYTVKGARVSENARLAAYQNADGSVNIYMIFSPGYTTGSYTVLENLQETVYGSPVNLQTQTPPGTLVFDTANPLYPPATTLDFTGVFEVDGNVNIDGQQLTIGPSSGGLFGDAVNTVIQGPQNVYLAPIGVGGTHVSMTDGSVHVGDPSAQPYAKLVFADGTIQSTAAVQDINTSNGVTTITNSTGTAGIQIASNSQAIGGIFGAGGNLNLQANSVTDSSQTGGLLELLGSQHGLGLNSQTYIFGNSVIGGTTPVGLLIDGQDHGIGIKNNVGIGLQPGGIPASALEVNGNVTLSIGSGASMTFQDSTVQSTAWNGVLFGGDYAESVDVSGDREEYDPGDVMVIDPTSEGRFTKSSTPYSTGVTGIYSTKPGVVGRRQLTARTHMREEVPMAMTGIVPTKVSAENGPILPGDLLVTSSRPGYAMKGTDHNRLFGAVLGKAIGHLDSGLGVIEAVITLQ